MKKQQQNNYEHLQDITLIIPTFNRSQFLARLLNYYAAKKTPIHFLILDSSDEPTKTINESLYSILGERCRYVAFPPSMPVATKLLEGLKLVKTPFCAFCADDDLVFIEGLSQALAFLHKNPDYVCADGIYLNFNQIETNVHLTVEYATKGINTADPGVRVFRFYQKYESLFYGVFRTQQALTIFSGVVKNPSLHYQELFQASGALLLGKSHRLPEFYAARQHCNPADMTRDKWQTYYWFADNPKEFLEHYLIYREELWRLYQTTVEPHYLQEEFFKILDLAHAMYFGTGCPPAYFHSVLQSKWPEDEFQKPNVFRDNICNQLKNPRHIWREKAIARLLSWLSNLVPSFYSVRNMKALNKKIQSSTNIQWNCELGKELRWLASVAVFRDAYHELCRYMSFSSEAIRVAKEE